MLNIDNKPIEPAEFYKWNVIDDTEFKTYLLNTFKLVSGAIVNTLGPYGSQVIIDKMGQSHVTKDGWNVLKNIRFKDERMVLNTIVNLLQRIAGHVVATVGDGSSSSIALSNALFYNLDYNKELQGIRPKDKQDLLKKACEEICEYIQANAKQIDKDGDLSEIYKLALISTNGNEEVSKMIQDIYVKTKNPTIYFKEAKGNETTYEITEGYKALVSIIDNIYINTDHGTCDVRRPYLLMFDHKVDIDLYPGIIHTARNIARDEGRKLIVIAPYYGRNYVTQMAYDTKTDYERYNDCDIIHCIVSTTNNVLMNEYSDFAILTGGRLFTELDFNKYREYYEKTIADTKAGISHSDDPDKFDISMYLGEVGTISMGVKDTTISDLYNKNDDMYNRHLTDAITQYEELRATNLSLNINDNKEYDMKQRVAKLKCGMGSIYVGGATGLERIANFDLVEDAVKACESAYIYGYNKGGSMVIVKAVDEILKNIDEKDTVYRSILKDIRMSAIVVFRLVLANKYNEVDDVETLDNIITDMLNRDDDAIYDLISGDYSTDIINSCRTDIEILKASVSIVSLLLSSSIFLALE